RGPGRAGRGGALPPGRSGAAGARSFRISRQASAQTALSAAARARRGHSCFLVSAAREPSPPPDAAEPQEYALPCALRTGAPSPPQQVKGARRREGARPETRGPRTWKVFAGAPFPPPRPFCPVIFPARPLIVVSSPPAGDSCGWISKLILPAECRHAPLHVPLTPLHSSYMKMKLLN
ncbi:hypothetical protein MC885_007352, partial [Smutsia gigantea]